MSALLRRYRALRCGRVASIRAAWSVEHGRLPEYEGWPEP